MPKGTQKVRFSFEETHITHFGGMWLIQRFCKMIGLKKRLQEYVRFSQKNQSYHPSELILALLYAIIMGLRRINKTEILQYNGAFLEMLGLKRFPDQSTIRRFLKRLPPKVIRQLVRLHDSLRAHLFYLPKGRTTLIFDLDSVVITIYGKQEGAKVGYNPKKRGRALLSSFALLRISFSRVLAWQFKARRYRKLYRHYSFPQSMFGQSPQDYFQISYSISDGPRLLRKSTDSFP